jgi:FHA domain
MSIENQSSATNLNSSPNQTGTTTPPVNVSVEHPTCPRCGRTYRPGELACPMCGIVFQDKLKTKRREEPEITPPKCYNCAKPYQPGALVCTGCGVVLDIRPDVVVPVDTKDLTAELAKAAAKSPGKFGIAPFLPMTIAFEIEGVNILVPFAEAVIIGRLSNTSTSEAMLDLKAFGAFEKGVSRRHLRIRRRGTLVYVADIGSANGTWLNGQRLIFNGERLLRHDDEVKLSHLTLRVKFTSWVRQL